MAGRPPASAIDEDRVDHATQSGQRCRVVTHLIVAAIGMQSLNWLESRRNSALSTDLGQLDVRCDGRLGHDAAEGDLCSQGVVVAASSLGTMARVTDHRAVIDHDGNGLVDLHSSAVSCCAVSSTRMVEAA